MNNCDIFINTIKNIEKYPVTKTYKLLCLGENSVDGKYSIDVMHDNVGDNISNMNKILCEFTGLYWVWKNYTMKKYVGFCQYRKFLSFYDSELNLDEIFKEHDIIVGSPINVGQICGHYKFCHNGQDLYEAFKIIGEMYPEYRKTIIDVYQSQWLYCCNIFIMRANDFNKYCEWMWPIIQELLLRFNIKSYDDCLKRVEENKSDYLKNNPLYPQLNDIDYQARFIAYLIERCTNVYIWYNFKNIKTFDIIETEMKYGTKTFK